MSKSGVLKFGTKISNDTFAKACRDHQLFLVRGAGGLLEKTLRKAFFFGHVQMRRLIQFFNKLVTVVDVGGDQGGGGGGTGGPSCFKIGNRASGPPAIY